MTARIWGKNSLPDDILCLIWEELPLEDLLYASHVCRHWRLGTLGNPRLWSRLELYAYDSEWGDDFEEEYARRMAEGETVHSSIIWLGGTVSNIEFLQHVLPRSGTLPLTLDITVAPSAPDAVFNAELEELLDLAAPRLKVLRFAAYPTVVTATFVEQRRSYPILRVLTVRDPARGDRPWNRPVVDVGFLGDSTPQLVRLGLHTDFHVQQGMACDRLEDLSCTVKSVCDIEALLLSAKALQRFKCRCLPTNSQGLGLEPDSSSSTKRRVHYAISAIPDVRFITRMGNDLAEEVFGAFASSQHARLRLDFLFENNSVPLQLHACRQLSCARHVTIKVDDDAIIIKALDDAERMLRIVLEGVLAVGLGHAIDWERVDALPALTELRVDSELWPSVGQKFPSCPQLGCMRVNIRQDGDIDALLGCRPLPHLVQGGELLIESDMPMCVTGSKALALLETVGGSRLSLAGGITWS
ncbi:hypothetical protein AURDEDRAFT_158917 [Auricularia subglabra TFB-10046 SS5]|nr:hypothetical protein AURDEDRAFT_158917 [Auricularia subglabra TFB-10046 SS5]